MWAAISCPPVALGHDVVNVSRGKAEPYRPHPAWDAIVSFEHSAAG